MKLERLLCLNYWSQILFITLQKRKIWNIKIFGIKIYLLFKTLNQQWVQLVTQRTEELFQLSSWLTGKNDDKTISLQSFLVKNKELFNCESERVVAWPSSMSGVHTPIRNKEVSTPGTWIELSSYVPSWK